MLQLGAERRAGEDSTAPLVSILIKSNDQFDYLERTFALLERQTVRDAETILIYSGQSNRTLDLAARCGAAVVTYPDEPFSHPKALNIAALRAQGEYVVCLSADAVPASQDWLAALVRPFICPSVAGVYGRHLVNKSHSKHLLERWKLLQRYSDRAKCKWVADGHLFSNANSALRRSYWQKHPFDERLASGCEDYEWARWAHLSGMAIFYAPEAAVYHDHASEYDFHAYVRRALLFLWLRWRIDGGLVHSAQGDIVPCPRETQVAGSVCPLSGR